MRLREGSFHAALLAAGLCVPLLAASAQDYRLAYSKAANIDIFVEGASRENWCARNLNLRVVHRGTPDLDALAELLPKLGALFTQQCPQAAIASWRAVDAKGKQVGQGVSRAAEGWQLAAAGAADTRAGSDTPTAIAANETTPASPSDAAKNAGDTASQTLANVSQVPKTASEPEPASFFGLPVMDGAIIVTEPHNFGYGAKAQEYTDGWNRLIYQLAYQAEPSLIETNPKIFASVLPMEVWQQFLSGLLNHTPKTLDQVNASLSWKVKNEFEVDEIKKRMSAALRTTLEKTRIPEAFDIVEIRHAALGTYDREAKGFPLEMSRGRSVMPPGLLPFVAPLPFTAWPRLLAMSEKDAQRMLNERQQEIPPEPKPDDFSSFTKYLDSHSAWLRLTQNGHRDGVIATRMTLANAQISSRRLELTFTYKNAAYYRDLVRSIKEADLPAFPGAYYGPDYLPPSDQSIPFSAIEPDAPFVAFVKTNPGAEIPDDTWRAAANSRFLYEKSLLADTLRYAALPTKRFSFPALRTLDRAAPEHVQAYKRAVLADTAPVPTRVSCPARFNAEDFSTRFSGSCTLQPQVRDPKDNVWTAYETIKREGEAFALLENTPDFTTILAFPHNGNDEYFTYPLKEDERKIAPNRMAYEFDIDQVQSSLGKSSATPMFALHARYAGMSIGDQFVPTALLQSAQRDASAQSAGQPSVTPARPALADFAIGGWQPPTATQRAELASFMTTVQDQNGCKIVSRFDFGEHAAYIRLMSEHLSCGTDGYAQGMGRLRLERSDGVQLMRSDELWFSNGLIFEDSVLGLSLADIVAAQDRRTLWFGLHSDATGQSHYLLRAMLKPHNGAIGVWQAGQMDVLTAQPETFREASTIRSAVGRALQVLQETAMPDASRMNLVFADGGDALWQYDQDNALYEIYATRSVSVDYPDGKERRRLSEWRYDLQDAQNHLFRREARLAKRQREEDERK